MDDADPYFTVQDEVLKNLEGVSCLYEKLLHPESSGDTQKLITSIKQSIRNIEWDLEDIQETVSIVENNPSRFQLTQKDVLTRQRFLKEARGVIKGVKAQLELDPRTSGGLKPIEFSVTAAKPRQTKESKLNGTLPNRNGTDVPDPTVETRSTTRPSVFPVHSDPLTEQQRMIRDQDAQLDQLGTSISTLKGMSRRIGDEIEDQVGLLEDFNSEMVHTESRLDQATKRTARLLHLSTDRRQWCAIGALTLILLIILILLVVL